MQETIAAGTGKLSHMGSTEQPQLSVVHAISTPSLISMTPHGVEHAWSAGIA